MLPDELAWAHARCGRTYRERSGRIQHLVPTQVSQLTYCSRYASPSTGYGRFPQSRGILAQPDPLVKVRCGAWYGSCTLEYEVQRTYLRRELLGIALAGWKIPAGWLTKRVAYGPHLGWAQRWHPTYNEQLAPGRGDRRSMSKTKCKNLSKRRFRIAKQRKCGIIG